MLPNTVNRFVRKVYDMNRRVKAYFDVKAVSNERSYYPEKDRKTEKERRKDLFKWIKEYGEINKYYSLWGMDVKGFAQEDLFLDYLDFRNSREKSNRVGKNESQVIILRDKYLFYNYMKSNSFPVSEVFGIIRDGKKYDSAFNLLSDDAFINDKDYFIKSVDGECASFVKHIYDNNELIKYTEQLRTGVYLLQKRIIQHSEMNSLYPNAINTIRIVTVIDKGEPRLFAAILRVGTHISGNVDNTSAGGFATGIRDDGGLYTEGFFKPEYGNRIKKHPDTSVILADFKIPFYTEAVDLACRAHKYLYNVFSIGWDIAITEKGPVFIEGNDNWEIQTIQAIYGGKKQEWQELIADYEKSRN